LTNLHINVIIWVPPIKKKGMKMALIHLVLPIFGFILFSLFFITVLIRAENRKKRNYKRMVN